MEAVILAAGRGSRLGPLTDDQPKCMMQLGGRTLIERCVEKFRQAGVERITLVGGYRSDILPTDGLNIVFNNQWASTGIAFSMLMAVDQVSGPVVVSYGDIVFEMSVLDALLDEEREGVCIAVNTEWLKLWRLRMPNVLDDAESLRWTNDRRIAEIGQPAQSIHEIQGQFMGLLRFSADAFSALCDFYRLALNQSTAYSKSARQWDMTTLLSRWMHIGGVVNGVPVSGGWLEVDTAADLELYTRLQRKGELAAICQFD